MRIPGGGGYRPVGSQPGKVGLAELDKQVGSEPVYLYQQIEGVRWAGGGCEGAGVVE
ncbi:hypothetical protein GCM10027280_50070 [Micromonospora polyrhachis]|uniref:hypothetical protein n=1 Tax=Micromonospora polyrhachis TaxID=1282883 RepID=UPI001FE93EEE|nr:hypothetical protein [Micromonospora polyrhachis]